VGGLKGLPATKEITQMSKRTSPYITLDELCQLLGVQTPVERFDHPFDTGTYSAAYDQAIEEGLGEGEAEELALQAESEEEAEIWGNYISAVEHVAKKLFAEHRLTLANVEKGKHRGEYLVSPQKSWVDSADEIIKTINGYGMFYFGTTGEFFRSGPYTPREGVLGHVHWIKSWPDVYEGTKARSLVEARLR
jgi:hypothetical protein